MIETDSFIFDRLLLPSKVLPDEKNLQHCRLVFYLFIYFLQQQQQSEGILFAALYNDDLFCSVWYHGSRDRLIWPSNQ